MCVVGHHRTPADRPRQLPAHGDRVELDLLQLPALVFHDGDDALPEPLPRREGGGAGPLDPHILEPARKVLVPQPLGLVVVLRLELDRLVLHGEVRQRVEDRLALVHLDRPQDVGAVAHEHVRARVDGRPGDVDEEVRRHLAAVRAFVRVARDDDPLGLTLRLLHDLDDLRQVPGVRHRLHARLVTRHEGHAAEVQPRAGTAAPSRHRERVAEARQLVRRHGDVPLVPDRAQPRAPPHVRPLVAGPHRVGEGRGDRDQRDASAGRVHVGRGPRPRQVLAEAGDGESRRLGRRHRAPRPAGAEVHRVVVRQAHHVEPEPGEFVRDLRLRPHVGAAARRRRDHVVLVVVEQDLEVHERGGRTLDDVAQREELGLPVRRHLPGDDRVAREGDGHVPPRVLERLRFERDGFRERDSGREEDGGREPGQREAGRGGERERKTIPAHECLR